MAQPVTPLCTAHSTVAEPSLEAASGREIGFFPHSFSALDGLPLSRVLRIHTIFFARLFLLLIITRKCTRKHSLPGFTRECIKSTPERTGSEGH